MENNHKKCKKPIEEPLNKGLNKKNHRRRKVFRKTRGPDVLGLGIRSLWFLAQRREWLRAAELKGVARFQPGCEVRAGEVFFLLITGDVFVFDLCLL